MSFYNLPHPWDPGYEIPDYVMAEPMGRGTFTTAWLPRGTVSTLPPDYLAKPAKAIPLGSLGQSSLRGSSIGGKSSLAGHSLAGDTLEAYRLEPLGSAGGGKNPVGSFASRAAALIVGRMGRMPSSQRKAYLRKVLRGIDPRLPAELGPAIKKAKSRGVGGSAATQAALAQILSRGFAREIIELGRGRGKKRGLLGFAPLGETGSSSEPWDFRNITRDHRKSNNMFYEAKFQNAWKFAMDKAGSAKQTKLKQGEVPFATFENLSDGGKKWGIYWNASRSLLSVKPVPPPERSWWGKVWNFLKSVGKGFTSAVRGVIGSAKDTLNSVKDMACDIVSSEAGQVAGAGVAVNYGAPPEVGAAGASAAASLCGKKPGDDQPPPQLPQETGLPGWVLPAAIGGGALLLVLAMR